eukprot:TRINITY_DN67514_c2_g1_i1.p1 TRINITY_DN67514_c2_g1~~TRINITY_DN67514_c2_g1_i1.p1  ORF type:complete len:229 (+),score=8.33 TRINITY_DN67514_c2_g1_i1:26-712(+)
MWHFVVATVVWLAFLASALFSYTSSRAYDPQKLPDGDLRVAIIVLSHEAVNCTQLTVDVQRRIEKACEIIRVTDYGPIDLVFAAPDSQRCGTAEARMMARHFRGTQICFGLENILGVELLLETGPKFGLPITGRDLQQLLEEKHGSNVRYKGIYVITRPGQLEWGMGQIRKAGLLYRRAVGIPSDYDVRDDIALLEEHMKSFPADEENQERLAYLRTVPIRGERVGRW